MKGKNSMPILGTYSQIIHLVTEFRKGLLGSKTSHQMCFVVSSALAGYLNFSGLTCKATEGFVGEQHHFWITLLDGRIIDATADQFVKPDGSKMPSVYIGKKPDWYVIENK